MLAWLKTHYVLETFIIAAIIFITCIICWTQESETTEISDTTVLDAHEPETTEIQIKLYPELQPRAAKKVGLKRLVEFLDFESTPFICGTSELDQMLCNWELENQSADTSEMAESESKVETAELTAEPTAEPDTYKSPETRAEPYFKVNDYQREVLIHLLYFEACGCKTKEDVLEQRAIISVVFNRFTSGEYKHCYDIEDIVFFQYPSGAWAFSPASNKDRFWFRGEWKNSNRHKDFLKNYDQLAEKVDWVIQNGPTVPENVKYFVSNACYAESTYFKNNHKVYKVYDDTTFMTDEHP